MKIIKSNAAEFKNFFSELRLRGGVHSPELLSSVAQIVSDVAIREMKLYLNIQRNLTTMN